MQLPNCTVIARPDPDAESSEPKFGAESPGVSAAGSLIMIEVDVDLTDAFALPPPPIVGDEVIDAAIVPCRSVLENCPLFPLDESMALIKAVSVAAAETKESKTVSGMTVSTASPPRPVLGEGASVGIVLIGMKRLT